MGESTRKRALFSQRLQSANRLLALVVLGIGSVVSSAVAANKTFTGPGNFSDASKWGGSLPGAGDTLRINGLCTNDNAAADLAYGTLEVGRSVAGTMVWPVGTTNRFRITGIVASSSSGVIDMSNGGNLVIGANNWITTGQTFIPGSGTIVWADTAAASTLPAAITTFNNLTIDTLSRVATLGAGITVNGSLTLASGTLAASSFGLTVNGDWIDNAGSFTAGTGPVTLNGTTVQVIGGTSTTSFNNLNISNSTASVLVSNLNVSGTLNVAAGATLIPGATNTINTTAAGTLTGAGTIHVTRTGPSNNDLINQYRFSTRVVTNLNVNYAGIGTQTVNSSVGAYKTLTLSGSGTKTLQGAVTNNGTLTIGSGVTLADGGFTLTQKGSVVNEGDHSGAGKVLLVGASSQTLSGTGTYGHLEVANTNGVSMASTMPITGSLVLTGGELVTGTNQVNLTAAATATRTAGWVNGTLQKAFNTGAGQSFVFPIGGQMIYRPAAVSNLAITTAGTLAASVTASAGNHPQIATSGINPSRDVSRWWTLTAGGGLAVTTYDITLAFDPSDVVGGANPAIFVIRKWNGSAWSVTSTGNRLATSTQATGLSSFSDFVIGEPLASRMLVTLPGQTFTSGSGNSGAPSNQTAGVPFAITLSAVGIFTNLDLTYSGLKSISYSGPSNALNGTTPVYTAAVQFNNGQGVATATLARAETTTLAATDGLLTSVPSSPVTATPAAVSAAQSTLAAAPATVFADGVSVSTNTVTLKDASGNPVAGKTVTLAKTTGAGSPTMTILQGITDASGVATFTVKSTTAATDTFTATDSTDGISVTQTASVTFQPGALDHFAISAIASPQTAGTPITGVTITAQDVYNNTVTVFNSAVAYSGSAGISGSSAAFTLGVLSNVSLTPTVAGSNLTVVATYQGKSGAATIATIASGSLSHYHIVFSSAPYYAQVAFTTYVRAEDANNNLIMGDNGTPFVVSSSSADMAWDADGEGIYGTDPSDTQVATINGVASITTKCLNSLGATQVVFSASNTVTHLVCTSAPIDIDVATDAYRTRASGDWSDPATWQRYDVASNDWVAAKIPPAYTNGVITIVSSNTVTVTANTTVDQVHIEDGAQLVVNSGVTLNVTNASAPGLEIYGTLNNSGTVSVVDAPVVAVVYDSGVVGNAGAINSSANSLAFYGGTYQHQFTTSAGTIPSATWLHDAQNATCAIIGYTSNTNTPDGLGQNFGAVTWNCPGQVGAISLGSAFTTAYSLDVHNTGTNGAISLGACLAATTVIVDYNATLHCGTNVISGGSFTLDTGGRLGIGSPDGITTNGATGNIQTASRSYGIGSCYFYEGTVPQVTGNGLPTTEVYCLANRNSAGLSLSQDASVYGVLELSSGALSIGANTLSIHNDIFNQGGTIAGGANSSLVIDNLGGFATNAAMPVISGGLKSLTITRATGATLTSPLTVWQQFFMTQGTLSGGSYLTLADGLLITRANGLVSGAMNYLGVVDLTVTIADTSLGQGLAGAANVIRNVVLDAPGGGNLYMATNSLMRGSLTIGPGINVDNGGFTILVNGSVTNQGTFSGTGRVLLSGGTAPHALAGTGHYSSIELNDALGATVNGPTLLDNTLTLTAGTLAGATNLSLSSGATILRAGGALDAAPTVGTTLSVNYTGGNSVTSSYELPTNSAVLLNLTLSHIAPATLTLNASRVVNGDLTIGANSTLADAGYTLTVCGNVYNNGVASGAGKIALNNAYSQVLYGSGSYGNLELVQGELDLAGDPTINGTLTTTSGQLKVLDHTLTFNGPSILGAATNLQTTLDSSLVFGGSAAGVAIPASVTQLKSLTLSNTNGLTLNADLTLAGQLTLIHGPLNTGSRIVHLSNPASGTNVLMRVDGWVNGSLSKYYDVGNEQAFTYYVGDATTCRPLAYTHLGVSLAGEMVITFVSGVHPRVATSGLNPAKTLPYYWRRTSVGRFTLESLWASESFPAADATALGADATRFADRGWMGDTSSWANMKVLANTATDILVVGVSRQPINEGSSYSEFVLGEPLASRLLATLPGQAFSNGVGSVGAPDGQVVGTPFSLTLSAVDIFNTLDASYAGARTIGYAGPGNGPGGDAPDYTTGVTFTNGQAASLAATLKRAETTMITATDGLLTGVPSSNLTVAASAASALAFTTPPVTVNAGFVSPTITVQRQDAFGNPIASDGAITVLLSSTSAGAVTFAPASVQIAAGASSATFTYSDTLAGTPTVTAESDGLSSATQQVTVVAAGSLVWDGASGTGYLSGGGNWTNNAPPRNGDALVFAGTSQVAVTNDYASHTPFGGITFNAGAGAFVLSGSPIALLGNIMDNAASSIQTIALNLELLATCSVDVVSGGRLLVSGIISGEYGLTKTGAGTLSLAGANTYTGDTIVEAGTLRVNNAAGSGTGFGAVTVNAGATLGGTGFIGGPVTISLGGTLAPGNSPGTITFYDDLTLSPGSTYAVEVDGATSDVAVVTGTATIDGAILSVTNLTAPTASSYTIITAGAIVGQFAGLWEGASVEMGSTTYYIHYTATDVVLNQTATPGTLYGYTFIDQNRDGIHDGGDGPVTNMLVMVLTNGVQVTSMRTDAAGAYAFSGLTPGDYEVRFLCHATALVAVPTSEPASTNVDRSRAVGIDSDNATILYTLASGETAETGGQPLNAGFSAGLPTAAAVLIRAYASAEGVVVEFRTIDESGSNEMVLNLYQNGQWVEVGRQPSVGEGNNTYRFIVPGLSAGQCCDLQVLDDEGYSHTAYGLTVGTFAADLVLMDRHGMKLSWNSLPDHTYEIYWTDRLGGDWTLITTVQAISSATSVVLDIGRSPAGFFKINLIQP